MPIEFLIKWLVVLAILLVLLLISYKFVNVSTKRDSFYLDRLDTLQMGPQASLQVIRFGQEIILFLVSPNNNQLILKTKFSDFETINPEEIKGRLQIKKLV